LISATHIFVFRCCLLGASGARLEWGYAPETGDEGQWHVLLTQQMSPTICHESLSFSRTSLIRYGNWYRNASTKQKYGLSVSTTWSSASSLSGLS